MKRLHTKPCNICGTPVEGIKRSDRNAYHYPPRCPNCSRKVLDPSAYARKIAALNKVRRNYPIGATRIEKSSEGLFYRVIKTPEGWKYEHRVVTNAPPGTHVHHLNGNTLDNRPENLSVLTPSEHRTAHDGLNGAWSVKFPCCQRCGTTTRKHSARGYCTACYQQVKKVGRGV